MVNRYVAVLCLLTVSAMGVACKSKPTRGEGRHGRPHASGSASGEHVRKRPRPDKPRDEEKLDKKLSDIEKEIGDGPTE